MPATISLLGLWNHDPTILDGLAVPDGIDSETVKTNILLECAELEILYPDPDFLKQAITFWSKERGPIWQKLQNTNLLEYNPIYNVEEHRVETRERTTESSTSGQSVGSSAALDSPAGTFSDREKTRSEAAGNGSEKETYTVERGGNIGVTTSQHMLQEEREVSKFDVIRYIIEDFKQRFCLLIY